MGVDLFQVFVTISISSHDKFRCIAISLLMLLCRHLSLHRHGRVIVTREIFAEAPLVARVRVLLDGLTFRNNDRADVWTNGGRTSLCEIVAHRCFQWLELNKNDGVDTCYFVDECAVS